MINKACRIPGHATVNIEVLVYDENIAVAILKLRLRVFLGNRPPDILNNSGSLANGFLRISTIIMNAGFLESQIFVLYLCLN